MQVLLVFPALQASEYFEVKENIYHKDRGIRATSKAPAK